MCFQQQGEFDATYGADFVFSAHSDELIVAHVFVRIFNEQPTFPLRNPREFCSALINFIGSQAQYLFTVDKMARSPGSESADAESDKEAAAKKAKRLLNTRIALQALRNVLKNNTGS